MELDLQFEVSGLSDGVWDELPRHSATGRGRSIGCCRCAATHYRWIRRSFPADLETNSDALRSRRRRRAGDLI
ncbi:hypothetical protein AAFF_G00385960 [Aldrovandia affinis]|uniref:Uncharacterized protein n=1 Tax=Aldrovandia affinis TaxID=143900 RepID=A0AAD7SF73_9TELE|nr:hypothetical protein AAFF_G00385960 [Aldrovandia affinis]